MSNTFYLEAHRFVFFYRAFTIIHDCCKFCNASTTTRSVAESPCGCIVTRTYSTLASLSSKPTHAFAFSFFAITLSCSQKQLLGNLFFGDCQKQWLPLFEHSASACAVSTPLAWSDQATPFGHSFSEQSGLMQTVTRSGLTVYYNSPCVSSSV